MGSLTELQQPDFGMQSLQECFYLLQKSLDRYEHLKKSGASDILLEAEKAQIGRQLSFLPNLRAELTKGQ